MAISDAQYTAWLKQANANRVTLVKLTYSAGSEYISYGKYVSFPADTPSNTTFIDCIISLPLFKSGVADVVDMSTNLSIGELVIDNSNGDRDAWLNRAWNGRAIVVYFGDPSWPFSDFRQILTGVISEIRAVSLDNLSFVIRGPEYEMLQPITTNYTSGDAIGQVKPLCFGECKKVPCILIDSTTHKYQVNDGEINAIDAVYDSGNSIGFTASLSDGTFTLSAAPSGAVTADVKGFEFSGTYYSGLTDLIDALVTNYTNITTSITPTDTTVTGIYVNSETDLLTLVKNLAISLRYQVVFQQNGTFDLVRVVKPESLSVDHTLTLDDVKEDGVSIVSRVLPKYKWTINHTPYFITQDANAIAGVVGEVAAQELGRAWRKEFYEDATILTTDLLAGVGESNAYIVSSSTAVAEAQARVELWDRRSGGQVRTVYNIECFDAPQQFSIGDVVSLDYGRLQMDGSNALIIGINSTIGEVGVSLTVLV